VSRSGVRFRAVEKPRAKESVFTGTAPVTLKLSSKDGQFSVSVNGKRFEANKKLRNKGVGQVGIVASNVLLIVNRIEIRGAVNKSKLKKAAKRKRR